MFSFSCFKVSEMSFYEYLMTEWKQIRNKRVFVLFSRGPDSETNALIKTLRRLFFIKEFHQWRSKVSLLTLEIISESFSPSDFHLFLQLVLPSRYYGYRGYLVTWRRCVVIGRSLHIWWLILELGASVSKQTNKQTNERLEVVFPLKDKQSLKWESASVTT